MYFVTAKCRKNACEPATDWLVDVADDGAVFFYVLPVCGNSTMVIQNIFLKQIQIHIKHIQKPSKCKSENIQNHSKHILRTFKTPF